MNSSKLVFYVMFIGALIFGAEALRQGNFSPITTDLQWSNLASLAIICTFITNVSLVYSVKRIGSTMTAVLGALEPLTAVIGCLIFNEAFNWQVMLGIALIIPAVIMIILTRRR
jgi:drug/metabolite transporter (DMT)-like permease